MVLGKDAFKLAPCRREFRAGAEVELDEAGLGLVRDVGGGGFQGDGIADAPGCRHAFLKRNRKLLVIYGDPEMAQQAGGKRVGQYARTGVEFRSQFGGEYGRSGGILPGGGRCRFRRARGAPVYPAPDGGDAHAAALHHGDVALCEDIADGRIDAAGDIGNDDDRLAGGGAHGDGGAGHVRELFHLFGGHVAGDVLRDDERFHILFGGEDAEAGGVGLAQIAAAPRVEGVGDGGVRREHLAEPFLPGLGNGREDEAAVRAHVRQHAHFAAGNRGHPHLGRTGGKAAQPAEQDGGFKQVIEGVDPHDVGTAEKGVEYPVASRDGPGMGGRHAAGKL